MRHYLQENITKTFINHARGACERESDTKQNLNYGSIYIYVFWVIDNDIDFSLV